MPWWTSLSRFTGRNILKCSAIISKSLKNGQIRTMSEHRIFPILPTRWQWDISKDMLHLYFCVGAIPVGIMIFCANVFVGPATLEPIPEGYIPKHWEYFRNPISRFLARYIVTPPQQDYEKYLHHLKQSQRTKDYKKLRKVVMYMAARDKDYDGIYYKPFYAKHIKQFFEEAAIYDEAFGD